MTQVLSADDLDGTFAPPLWRDAVVGASVAAMAAAAGLGAHYEVGVAPWLAMSAAGVTALALWGAHRQFGHVETTVPPATVRKVRRPAPPRKTAEPALREASIVSAAGDEVPAVVTPTAPSAIPLSEKPELSSFMRRPAAQVAVTPSAFGSSDAPAEAAEAALRSTPPAMPAIDPEAQFLRLQGLVRQLATDVAGPRATTNDPDMASGVQRVPHHIEQPLAVGFAPVPPAQPASQVAASPMAQRLAEAVASERLDVLLEPIQLLAESRARHFEISVRFRSADGAVLPPDDVSRLARTTGLSSSIDALKLPRVAKVVQRVQSRGGTPSDVVTALAGASLADHTFMEAFATSFTNGAPQPLVLSFPQSDVRAFARVHWSALNALGDMGLRFALNDVTDLDMDFELLRARSFVFAKLDADVFLNGLPCGGAVIPADDICKHIADAGLSLIVARLDTEEQFARIAGYQVPFGQGRLFGGARPVKSDILQ
jgi:cyclic-di-GMP phosphodiesterase, flagellum assembly factor TipF